MYYFSKLNSITVAMCSRTFAASQGHRQDFKKMAEYRFCLPENVYKEFGTLCIYIYIYIYIYCVCVCLCVVTQ